MLTTTGTPEFRGSGCLFPQIDLRFELALVPSTYTCLGCILAEFCRSFADFEANLSFWLNLGNVICPYKYVILHKQDSSQCRMKMLCSRYHIKRLLTSKAKLAGTGANQDES